MKKLGKILLIVLGSIIGLVVLFLGSLNVIKFALYSEYYGIRDKVAVNPGLNEGAVPQGIAVDTKRDIIITSAYMADKSASRLYVTNSKNKYKYVELYYENGKAFTGHVGGVSLSGDYVYIANDDRIYKISLDDVLTKSSIQLGESNSYKVNNQASFTFADDEYLYVGEFHYGPYVCEHEIGDYHAICTKYDLDDLTTPVAIYSIRDKVQGFCVTDEGDIVLSTSLSLADSHFYVYDSENIVQNGTYQDVPLYILDNPSKVIKAPAMSEDLSYSDGKVYTMYENACNKYIFGKFFFASNKVVALDFE